MNSGLSLRSFQLCADTLGTSQDALALVDSFLQVRFKVAFAGDVIVAAQELAEVAPTFLFSAD